MRNRTRPFNFALMRSLGEARDYAGYSIPTLPDVITSPTTYTLQLAISAVDPCDGDGLTEEDEGAIVKQQYSASYRRIDGPGPTDSLGRPIGGTVTTQITMFAAYLQPTDVDVTSGEWHQVREGDLRGVYWRGTPYRDKSGAQWLGDVGVLAVERENMVVTLVGSPAGGATEEMMFELVRNMRW